MKTILYRPADQTGLGNRLRGLTLCYAISLATGRRLLVEDYLITEFFFPPWGLDWDPSKAINKKNKGSWRVLIQNLSSENWDQAAYDAYQTRDLNDLFPEDVVEVVQGASFIDALRINPVYASLWESLGLDVSDRFQWNGRLVERLLSRPKPKLMRAVRRLKRRIDWDEVGGLRVGVQYRTFFDVGSPHLAAVDGFIASLEEAFGEAPINPPRFFVTTDDQGATQRLQESLARRGEVFRLPQKNVVHTGPSYSGWSELLFKLARRIVPGLRPERFDPWRLVPEPFRLRPQRGVYAEWYLLGECSSLYSTYTTFAEFAAARCGNVAGLVQFDPDQQRSITLKPETRDPLISVITASYNSLSGLRATHESLPTDPDFEYLLVDGGSTDGTAEFVGQPGLKYHVIVRERDKGVFDAMNKGILRARGRYLLFLNCGDRFSPLLDWQRLKASLQDEAVVIGGLDVDDGGRVVVDQPLLRPQTLLHSALPHQAAFIPRRLFQEYGLYDLRYTLTADQEWFFRTLKGGARFRPWPQAVALYQSRGMSDLPENAERIRREKTMFLRHGWGIAYGWYTVIHSANTGLSRFRQGVKSWLKKK